MSTDECFQLGYVIKKHGLKGEVNILLDVDEPQFYKDLESVYIEINNKLVPFFIISLRLKGNRAVVTLEDVQHAEQADSLKGKRLYLPLKMLPDLSEGQFYFHEIMNYSVIDEKAGKIGTVSNIYSSSQQDLMAVDYNGKEILVPIQDEIITKLNHGDQEVYVNLPDGLLEIYLD